jgi:hypothetical protein
MPTWGLCRSAARRSWSRAERPILVRHNPEVLDRVTVRPRSSGELGGRGICQDKLLRGKDTWQAVAPSAACGDHGDYADITGPDRLLTWPDRSWLDITSSSA